MKRISALIVIIVFFLSIISPRLAYGGWKENYRTKYSKRQLDPNSEKAKRIRRLCNFDVKFLKWTKTPEERKALGIEPKRTLSANLMPWKRRGETRDKFEGYSTNFSPARIDLPKEEPKVKSGYTLTGIIKKLGGAVDQASETLK